MDLPLFPLHTVLFPGATLPLHVFEPRYRLMLDHVTGGDRAIGIVAIKAGLEVGGRAEIHEVGTLATLADVARNEDGTLDIIVTGRARFRIERRLDDAPYPSATVDLLADADEPGAAREIAETAAAVARMLATAERVHDRTFPPPALPDDPTGASYALAAALDIDLVERQRLLAIEGTAARCRAVREVAERESVLLDAIGPSVGRPSGDFWPN